MYVNIGDLDKRIEIITTKPTTKNENGFPISKETSILKTWAQVTNTSGTEIIKNNSDFKSVSTRFFIRTPKKEITNEMKVKFRSNIYEIDYVHDYEYDNNFTEIMTKLVKQ